ncbi:MAG: anti-sigma F factor [Clostridiales bacterium]|nr:anti-sigma F factor [Clostridiales bacterium]
MKTTNKMKLVIESRSVNEGFARAAVAAFAAQLDPTVEELADIKTAVSEAVTNCIVHAYPSTVGLIYITAELTDSGTVKIKIRDRGCGIADVRQAMEPLFTTLGGERSGLGFAVMESFMDKVKVTSTVNKGTCVTMTKNIASR